MLARCVVLGLAATSAVAEIFTGSAAEVDRCTSIAVGKLAGVSGPMNTHTADCADCDFRLNKVPARDWAKGTKRPLYVYRTAYPATVTSLRGDTWLPSNLEGTKEQKQAWGSESTIEGYIPEVPHTYALYEAGYGIINEHQVAIGESTCQGRFYGIPVSAGGQAQVEIREMTHVALERSTTARQAIQTMGDLATSLGFYGADWSGGQISMGEAGEALTVVDKTEAWMFHVTGDDTGTSAIWVAQRIPDNHISVVANQFVIRGIVAGSDDFMYSANIFDVATRNGLWSADSGTNLDFLKVYAPERAHSPYATRRVWRVFSLAAPSFVLPPVTDPFGDDYPFSVPVDQAIDAHTLMRYQRDHYEGSQFDLTQGVAAGPFGTPDRYDGAPNGDMNLTVLRSGGFERAISLFRTSYSFVSVPRESVPDALAMMWFTQYAPSSSVYTPMYVGAKNPPKPYMHGSLFQFDASVSYWNFNIVGNYASHMYKYVIPDVQDAQADLETQMQNAIADFEARATKQMNEHKHGWQTDYSATEDDRLVDMLTDFTDKWGNKAVDTWKNLLPQLITKHHDGYTATNLTSPRIVMKRNGYPQWWLQVAGYFNGDNAPNVGPDVIQFMPNPAEYVPVSVHNTRVWSASLFSGLLCLIAGVVFTKKYLVSAPQSRGYDRIGDEL